MSNFEDFMIGEASQQSAEIRRLNKENAELRKLLKSVHDEFTCPVRNTHLGRHYGSATTISSQLKGEVAALFPDQKI